MTTWGLMAQAGRSADPYPLSTGDGSGLPTTIIASAITSSRTVSDTVAPFIATESSFTVGGAIPAMPTPLNTYVDIPVTGLSYSNNGQYLAVFTSTTVNVYTRTGLRHTRSTTTNNGIGTSSIELFAWDPSDTYLFAASVTGDTAYKMYKRSGTTLTAITFPTFATASAPLQDATWNPAGTDFAMVRSGTSNSLLWYTRSSDTFTPVAVTVSNRCYGARFSPNGQYLAVTYQMGAGEGNRQGVVLIYQRTGSTVTLISTINLESPTTSPTGLLSTGLAWAPDSSMLVVSYRQTIAGVTSYLKTISRSGTVFTLQAGNPVVGGPATYESPCRQIEFDADGDTVYASFPATLVAFSRSGLMLNYSAVSASGDSNRRFTMWPTGRF